MRKLQAFLGALLLLLIVTTTFKLHTSSVGVWNRLLSDPNPRAGILVGTPKDIRSDEWLLSTPAMVSQAMARPAFPLINPAWGNAPVLLIMNLPCRHWSMVVRPQFWGFFTLDLERGFAFYWNMKACLLAGGIFLLLMTLTRNDFGVSLLGTAWVFFSGFMQWWYSTPAMLPETVGYVALLIVAIHHLVLSRRRWVIAAAGVGAAVCLINFAVVLYPPFQVPLFYLAVAILAGSLGPRMVRGPRPADGRFRVAVALVSLFGVAVALGVYYLDAKPAIDLMRATIYPGSRLASGGDVPLAQMFGGFFGFLMTEASFPHVWRNVCESSNFVLLFPVPLVVLAVRAWRNDRATALEWGLGAYIVFMFTWMTLRVPQVLALLSGIGLSPGRRSLLGLGLASIILCCVFLAQRRTDVPEGRGSMAVVALAMLGSLGTFAVDFGRVTERFANGFEATMVVIVAAVAAWLLLARKRVAFAVCLLVPSIWSCGLVNPIAVGLGPILDAKLFREVRAIVEREPEARWAALGGHDRRSNMTADFLKAAGARVFGGTNIVPPSGDLRVLDPGSEAAPIYSRFAHIELVPDNVPDVVFTPINEGMYQITVDPMSERFRKLGIRYVVLPFAANNVSFREATSLVLEDPESSAWVYRYR